MPSAPAYVWSRSRSSVSSTALRTGPLAGSSTAADRAGTSRGRSCRGSSDDRVGRAPVRWGRLLVENHRGALVPRVLGIALAIDAVVWTVVVATFADVGAA